MLNVSQAFKDAMLAGVRRVIPRVTIGYTDPFLDQTIDAEASEQNRASAKHQVFNGVKHPAFKYASLEPGVWKLGEGFKLAPSNGQREVGWRGRQLSDNDRFFSAPYPTLTVTFSSRPVDELQVIGDSKREEWPEDFTIRVYSDTTLVYTETATGNADVIWNKEIDPLTEITSLELEITRWSHAQRFAKIVEFYTSVQEIYEGDDVLLINLTEERDVSDGSLPIGNISANEIEVRLNNIDRKFDAGNVESPLYQLLKPNRRLKAELGLELPDESIEYVPLFLGWTQDWQVPEGEAWAHTTARDRLELLRKTTYSDSIVHHKSQALVFNGVGTFAQAKSQALPQAFTIRCRISADSLPTETSEELVATVFATAETGVRVGLTSGGNVQFLGTYGSSGNWNFTLSHPFPFDGEPHDIMCRWDGTTDANAVQLYLDGNLVDQGTAVAENDQPHSHNLTIGRAPDRNERFFNGLLYDVSIFGDEVIADYQLNGSGRDATGRYNLTITNPQWQDIGEEKTLYDATIDILTDAGVSEYWVDPELQEYTIPFMWFDRISHREALRRIAEACLGQCYVDRIGVIRVEGPSFLQSQTESALTITADNYFRKDNPIRWSEVANSIEATSTSYRPAPAEMVYETTDPETIPAGASRTITIFYDESPCIDAQAYVLGNAEIESASYYGWGAVITLTTASAQDVNIQVFARKLNPIRQKHVAEDNQSIVENGRLVYSHPENSLIQRPQTARDIAESLLVFADPRRDINLDWRGHLALALADRITAPDYLSISTRDYYVVSQSLNYDGTLRANLTGRRASE